MIGGKVIAVEIDEHVTVTVSEQPCSNDQCRCTLPLNRITRCIGIGDALWWQGKQYMWTPQASKRTALGRDFDIQLVPPWA
jgi:hypothetical protein